REPYHFPFGSGRTLTSLKYTRSPGSWVCRPMYPTAGRLGSRFGSYHSRAAGTSLPSGSNVVTRFPSASTSTRLPSRVMVITRHLVGVLSGSADDPAGEATA